MATQSQPMGLHELYRMVRLRQGIPVEDEGHEDIPRFRFAYFNARLLLHFSLLTGIGYLGLVTLGRTDVINSNLRPRLGPLLIVLVIGLVVMCFAEYFLHLYPMHKGLYNPTKNGWFNTWMRRIKHSHDETHHGSTKVSLSPKQGKVVSRHPITDAEQTQSATFPTLALFGFWAIFALPVVLIQLIWPTYPVLLGAALAISWAMWLYENIHAIHHFPEEWWRQQCRKRFVGRLMLLLYMHHFVHHLNTRRNLNVGGVALIPVADIVLGSFVNLQELLHAWLYATQETDLTGAIDRAIARLNKQPWSWQIRSTLNRVLFRAG